MICTNDQVVFGAYFMEGLHEVGYAALIERWSHGGSGNVEMIQAVCAYIEPLARLTNAAAAIDADTNGFPGVLEYEVAGPFGNWWANKILQTGTAPKHEEALAWLRKEVIEFFSQGLISRTGHPFPDGPEKLADMINAVNACDFTGSDDGPEIRKTDSFGNFVD